MKTETYTNPRLRPGGFTLTEILIAIGIMGIGMVMVGALFPVAAKEASLSTDDAVGSLICHNALATIKSQLRTSDIASVGATLTPILTSATVTLTSQQPAESLAYPSMLRASGKVSTGTTTTLVDNNANWQSNRWAGFMAIYSSDGTSVYQVKIASNTNKQLTFDSAVSPAPVANQEYAVCDNYIPNTTNMRRALVLARQMVAATNDYLFVIVSVVGTRDKPDHMKAITATPSGSTLTATSDINSFAVYNFVVDSAGNYAKVTAVNKNANIVTLDHPLSSGNVYVPVYTDAGVDKPSHAMGVLVARTALRTN